MLKKLLVGGAISVAVIGVLLVLLLRSKESGQQSLASEAVPSGAILFVDQIDYTFFTEDFRATNQLWSEMLKHRDLAALDSITQRWTSRIGMMPSLSSRMNKGALSMSLHLQGKSNIAALFYIQLGDEVSPQEIENEIMMVAGAEAEINTRKYEAVELTDVSLGVGQGSDQFSYVFINGLMIAGRSSLMLEDAIRAVHSGGGIFHQKGFQVVAETAGKYVHGNL